MGPEGATKQGQAGGADEEGCEVSEAQALAAIVLIELMVIIGLMIRMIVVELVKLLLLLLMEWRVQLAPVEGAQN